MNMQPADSRFPCTACGLCCQHIGQIEALKSLDRGDGICSHFDEQTKACRIYEERPLVCRVDAMYAAVYRHEFKDRRSFYQANAAVCNALQKEHGVSAKLRVKVS